MAIPHEEPSPINFAGDFDQVVIAGVIFDLAGGFHAFGGPLFGDIGIDQEIADLGRPEIQVKFFGIP